MDIQGSTRGRILVILGTMLVLSAGIVRLAEEIPAVSLRYDIPSDTTLGIAGGVGVIMLIIGALRGIGNQ